MLLHNRYNYPKLKRLQTPAGRQYVGESELYADPVPSVTTVLDSTADKTFLIEWKKRIGEDEANRQSQQAAGLGTKVHNALEKYILGEEWDSFGNNMVSILARKMSRVMIDQGMSKVNELWGTEVGLIAQGLYAGTSDAIGIYEGEHSIIDFKTAKKLKKREWIEDYFLQGCAYALAHNEMFGTEIRKVSILMVDREAQFQDYVIKGDEFDHYCHMWGDRLAQYYSR
jgi:ATP-dependent exoDNAse (exonuclease V) beta subunit